MTDGKTSIPKPIFDRKLIRARRARGRGMSGDAFLYLRTAEDAIERIKDVNRSFEKSLIIGSPEISDYIENESAQKLGHVIKADHTNLSTGVDIVCDEESLPFSDRTFDFIFSGLTLHSVNAIPKTLMDIKSLLKPDGLFVCALFGGASLRRLRYALYEAEDMTMGQASPRIAPMIELQQAASLLQKAGFTMPVVDRDMVTVNYASLSGLYSDLARMGERNVLNDRIRSGATKALFSNLEQIYARDHKNSDGKLEVGFDIVWMTGWAPDPKQPKPLKPGSAKSRLSDALGVKEHKL